MTRGVRRVCSSFLISPPGCSSSRSGLERLEAQARQDSRTSSKPPSIGSAEDARAAAGGGACEGQGADAPGGRAARGWRAARASGCGSRAASRRIRWMRSSITTRMRVAGAGASSMMSSAGRAGGSVATRSASCRRSA